MFLTLLLLTLDIFLIFCPQRYDWELQLLQINRKLYNMALRGDMAWHFRLHVMFYVACNTINVCITRNSETVCEVAF